MILESLENVQGPLSEDKIAQLDASIYVSRGEYCCSVHSAIVVMEDIGTSVNETIVKLEDAEVEMI